MATRRFPFSARLNLGCLEGRVVPATFNVSSLADSGTGSLRQAVQLANGSPGGDTITFDTGLPGTIVLTGEIGIVDALTIMGPGSNLLTIQGASTAAADNRLFNINTPGAVSLQGMTLTGGNLSTGDGAAILSSGSGALSLTDVAISGNTAARRGGGMTINGTSPLNITDCRITNNKALNSDGGGIHFEVSANATIDQSEISGNTAGTSGGGLYLLTGGNLSITNSTISGNTAGATTTSYGGGLALFGPGTILIQNSTVSGNGSGGHGGGIALAAFTGGLTLQNSTVAFNHTNISGSHGGGLARISGSGGVTLDSTIVAKNTTPDGLAPDLYFAQAVTLSANKSLIGIADTGGMNQIIGTTLYGKMSAPLNPLLGPLADNGGPTKTHALLAGSPALNAGGNSASLAYDQRGIGFPRAAGAGPDIGAFEVSTVPQVQSVIINGGAVQRSRVTSIVVTFDSLVTLPATPASAFQLLRQPANTPVALTAMMSNTNVTAVTLTFNGALSEFTSLVDGRYTLKVIAASVSGPGGQLDGNGDGTAGDDYVLVGTPANGLFRLFGDNDGNGFVNVADFLAFRNVYGGMNPTFDFDNDGVVGATDFLPFRFRFGSSA